jgi:hypothetical protein
MTKCEYLETGPGTFRCARCGHERTSEHPAHLLHRKCDKPGVSIGLGDTIAKGLGMMGVRKRKGCGCGKRQQKLNEWFPY